MRKTKPKKRQVLPDPVYGDVRVTKFVNHLMYDGKKSISYDIFYSALNTVKAKLPNEEKSALEIWKAALDNITPQVEVKSRRVGGATFQVPTEIRPERKESISMKNLILYARKRGGKRWQTNWPPRLLTLSTIRVEHTNVKRTCTEWQKQIGLLLNSEFKIKTDR